MTIRINQPRFKLSVLCGILCELYAPKQPEHKAHKEKIHRKVHKVYVSR